MNILYDKRQTSGHNALNRARKITLNINLPASKMINHVLLTLLSTECVTVRV